ncbi:MAG: CHAT domain-containing protein [Pirellulales bacterium]
MLLATTICVAPAVRAPAEPLLPNHVAAQLARAEQFYDDGNYRQAAQILEQFFDHQLRQPAAGGEVLAATRLLAQLYHRSGDYSRAAQVAERFARLTPLPDAEMLLVLADCHLSLGRDQEAARELEKFRTAFGNSALSDLREARLAVDAERITTALHRGEKRSANSTAEPQDHFDPSSLANIDPERYQPDQRYQAVKLLVARSLESNRFDEAAALLAAETRLPIYNADESVELKLQLADCYRRAAALHEDLGDDAARQVAVAGLHRTVDDLAEILNRRRNFLTDEERGQDQGIRVDRISDMARLLSHEATVQELNAEFAEDSVRTHGHLTRAAQSYRALAQKADELEALSGQSRLQAESRIDQIPAPAAAANFRDSALSGLQRVYEGLRLSSRGESREQVLLELSQVSNDLVAHRSRRLLSTDPALYNAKRAQASVLSAMDDRTSRERACAVYRELVAFWDASPRHDAQSHATALIGLAEALRGLDQTRDAYASAQQARRLIAEAPIGEAPISRRQLALLAARIDNSLGVTSITLGEYRDALQYLVAADGRLKSYGESATELRRKNQQALHVLSRVKVYRALLHQAEAQYDEAATRVREGRQLREKLADDADLLAFYLAEASVHLAQARALMHERGLTPENAPVRAALESAETALNRAHRFNSRNQEENKPRPMDAALPYQYLRGVLARLNGSANQSRQIFAELAQRSEQYGDSKTAAKSYMQLAQLVAEAGGPASSNDVAHAKLDATTTLSRTEGQDLRRLKLERRAAFQEAADYAARAVALFQKMDRAARADDVGTTTALPSLHFQASFLAARLHVVLAALDDHIMRLDVMMQGEGRKENAAIRPVSLASADIESVDHRQLAIDFLEDAVRQAERPASSTTQVRLQRAKFFSRYAPAYDLLVDLLVASAAGDADRIHCDPSSAAFVRLRRAIEIADLARNRTFREQIDGWRESAGNTRALTAFDWDAEIAQLATPGTALLMYHLDGRQLLAGGSNQAGIARIGGGHLIVILDQGRQVRYYRLQHTSPESAQPSDLTRSLAADLVRRHISWIERPESAPDWGRAEQRALTDAVLPRELLESLLKTAGAGSDAPIRHLLIIPDGALHQLPFESLLLPQAVASRRAIRYALDDLPPIRYGPSLSVLAALDKTAGQGGDARLLTVGNPAYPDPGRQTQIPAWGELFRQIPGQASGFPALTHSEQECESVYASFDELSADNRTKLMGAAATEAAVRQFIPSSRFIHLAAHGCVDYQNDNLQGALVFAPGDNPNAAENDGILQLRDIYGLDLSGCELAVLSACQTYVGPERPLEAGTSMARAFLEQGARRVVCSQWSTDDRATTDFMKAFFSSIREARQAGAEIDYSEALHKAKQVIRNDPDRRSLPRYWAPFILVGAP